MLGVPLMKLAKNCTQALALFLRHRLCNSPKSVLLCDTNKIYIRCVTHLSININLSPYFLPHKAELAMSMCLFCKVIELRAFSKTNHTKIIRLLPRWSWDTRGSGYWRRRGHWTWGGDTENQTIYCHLAEKYIFIQCIIYLFFLS